MIKNQQGIIGTIAAVIAGLVLVVIAVAVFAPEILTRPELEQAQQKAYDKERVVDLKNIQTVLENYYSNNNAYPRRLEKLTNQYVQNLPKDPETNQDYSYNPTQCNQRGCSSYVLTTNLKEGTELYSSGPFTLESKH